MKDSTAYLGSALIYGAITFGLVKTGLDYRRTASVALGNQGISYVEDQLKKAGNPPSKYNYNPQYYSKIEDIKRSSPAASTYVSGTGYLSASGVTGLLSLILAYVGVKKLGDLDSPH